MADIKRFTGFIAQDGSTHDSMKAAVKHMTAVKVLDALNKDFGTIDPSTHGNNVTMDDGRFYVSRVEMPMFLLDNREKIEACFAASATLRAPRKPKAPKTQPEVLVS